MNGNETIRKLLLDEKQSEVLELYEKCEINSFLEIEKYYSGGCMEVSDNNACDILRFSIYYNDNRIMSICKKYLKTHLNESIMIEIFSILNGLNHQKLNDLKGICERYLMKKAYKYLNNDDLLLKLNIESLNLILSNRKLIIEDESWLLNRLLLWYKNHKMNGDENEEEDVEEKEEFVKLLKKSIHLNEIKYEKISEENKLILKDLKVEIFENETIHIRIKMDDINNEELIEMIDEYYVEEEENEIELNEREIIILSESEEDLIKLLSNEDVKVVEIVLNIILKMKMNRIIPNEIKNRILLELLYKYRRNKRNRSLKCFCLFVNDKKNIIIMEGLCGKEILYQILNEEYYLNSKSKELLIEYIQGMKLSVEEEVEMSKIIKNEEILEELLIKEISSFSYPQSEYSFPLYEEFSIIPSFDGDKCEFLISPPLPFGVTMNKETGIINGKVENEIEKKEYEITCKNKRSEKKFKISLEFVDVKYSKLNKSNGTTISSNGKIIEQTSGQYNHCYLNLKMGKGIYHIKIKYLKQDNGCAGGFLLGLSTNNTYSGTEIYNQSTTCNYYAQNGKSKDITSLCHIGTIVNKNPNFDNHGEGSVYEMIVDMNKREYWISHNNSSPVLLVKDLPSPLYPYSSFKCCTGNKHELLSVSHQN